MIRFVPAALLLTVSLAAAAQSESQAASSAACAAVLAKPFDGGLDPRIQPDCDSTAFYYGISRDKDVVAARSCALIERINHVDKDGNPFTGVGILSMIYANGEGTPRDTELAKRFVCENKEASPEEIEARLKLLDRIAESPKDSPRFVLCSTSVSGLTAGWCAGLLLRIHDAKRYDEMVKIVDGIPAPGVEAFKALQTAEGAFESVRAEKEIDLTGTARGALILQEQDKVRAQFVSDLKLFAKPDFSEPVTLVVVESDLSDDLAKLRANGPRIFRNTTITVEGVDETQRAWLKYRDAWRAYEGVVNPTVSGDAVATQLDRERYTQLQKLVATF